MNKVHAFYEKYQKYNNVQKQRQKQKCMISVRTNTDSTYE